MIQITPQMRVVAVEAVDLRKGIDSLAGAVVPRQARRRSVLRLPVRVPLTARHGDQGPGLRRPGVLAGDQAAVAGTIPLVAAGETARELQAHQAQLLLAAGNADLAAAPVWRKVS
jgi:hypothetical protein